MYGETGDLYGEKKGFVRERRLFSFPEKIRKGGKGKGILLRILYF